MNRTQCWASCRPSQKLVSFMCGLGLVGGPGVEPELGAGLVAPTGLSGEAGLSAGGPATPWRGDTDAWERVGLRAGVGAGLVGEVGVALRCSEDEGEGDSEEGAPREWRDPGDTENVLAVLSPKRASSSLHTAKLRRTPSDPGGTANPGAPAATAAASEPFARSWQTSTKLPRRTKPSRSGCLGRGLAERFWLWVGPA